MATQDESEHESIEVTFVAEHDEGRVTLLFPHPIIEVVLTTAILREILESMETDEGEEEEE